MANKSFESSLLELEKIVAQLEKGDLPLEKTLDLYQKGVELTKKCNIQLKDAKLKIEQLKPEKQNEAEQG